MPETTPVRDTQSGMSVAATPDYGNHHPKTANYTLLKSDSGKIFSNKGAGGAVTFTLPAPIIGLHFHFVKLAAQNLTIQAASGALINNSAANGTFANATNGESMLAHVKVICLDGANWFVLPTGTWTTT